MKQSNLTSKSKFVIFANARSGSTSLAKLLAASPDVKLALEPFHPDYSDWNPEERNYSQFIENTKTMNVALDEIFQQYTAIKVLAYQFAEEIYTTMLGREDLKIIFLRRKNLVQAALSSLIGDQTGIWHKKDFKAGPYNQLEVVSAKKIRKIVNYVRDVNKYYSDFLKKNRTNDYLFLYYEQLYSEDMQKNRDVLTTIVNFLEIKPPSKEVVEKYMKPSNARQNQNNLYSKVPNYAELKQEFPDQLP